MELGDDEGFLRYTDSSSELLVSTVICAAKLVIGSAGPGAKENR